MSFEAKYPGRCVGDQVMDTDREIEHTDCDPMPDVDEPRRTERKCPDCFLIHAGECP